MQTQQAPKQEFAAGWMTFVRELEAKGAARATRKALSETLPRQLEQRDILVDAATRKRVLACKSIAKLERWLGRVLIVRRAADLFA